MAGEQVLVWDTLYMYRQDRATLSALRRADDSGEVGEWPVWLVPRARVTVESGLPANPRRLFRVLRNGLDKFSFR